MSLRLNHNISSIKAHRGLLKNDAQMSKSLERLSSGLKINSASDSPSALVASEQMRAHIASIDQAIQNSEASVSMIQTAEGALSEVNSMLVGMRQLAIHAANEGANDPVMSEADQSEIDNMLAAIDRVSGYTKFGSKKLLDGSNGVSGTPIGKGLEFIKGTGNTKSSSAEGYEVTIESLATSATLKGSVGLTGEIIAGGEELSVTEGGKSASYTTVATDTAETVVKNLAAAIKRADLDIGVKLNTAGALELTHNKSGSGYEFSAASSTGGVLSGTGGAFEASVEGKDISGKINGESAIGKGDILTGKSGNENTDGLTVRFRGVLPAGAASGPDGATVGRVAVTQNSLSFQVGPDRGQTVDIALQNSSANHLGKGSDNKSNFRNLADIDVKTAQGASDSIQVIDEAIQQVSKMRAELGSFQKNTLEVNIANMRTASENMIAAESNIRDVDMAQELAQYTKSSLMLESSNAMLAQANQSPMKVLSLISD